MNQQMEGSKWDSTLSSMSKQFATAQKQAAVTGGDVSFPEGTFVGKVTAKLKDSQSSGNLMVSRTFIPVDGEMQGVPCYDNLVISQPNPTAALRAQRDLIRFLDLCGYQFDPDQATKLPYILAELSKEAPVVRFRVRHSHSSDGSDRVFTNVDVLELVTATSEDQDTDGDSNEEGSDTLVDKLKEFCDASSIAYEDESEEGLKSAIKEHCLEHGKFASTKLTPEETVILETAGLKSCIATQVPSNRPTGKGKPATQKGKGKR